MPIITKYCTECEARYQIELTEEQNRELMLPRHERRHVLQILSSLAPAMREMFLSGICPECRNAIFADRKEQSDPRLDPQEYRPGGKFQHASLMDVIQVLREVTTEELRYQFAKLALEKDKKPY